MVDCEVMKCNLSFGRPGTRDPRTVPNSQLNAINQTQTCQGIPIGIKASI